MKTSIEGILREIKSNQINPYYVILECIKNSLQANSSEIYIDIYLSFKKEKYIYYLLKVVDNGDGFNSDNLKSFHITYTLKKKNLGCRGIGRFSMLKAFKNITISTYSDNNEVLKIKFDKDYEREIKFYEKSMKETIHKPKTIFELKNPHKDYEFKLEDISDNIKKDLFPILYFKSQKGEKFSIKLTLRDINKSILKGINEEYRINNEFFMNFNIKERNFNMIDGENNQSFKIYYYIEKAEEFILFNNSRIVLCANGQAVEDIKLNKLPVDFKYFIFISGDFLNYIVSNDRISFNFYEESNQSNIFTFITKDKLKRKIVSQIFNILKEEKGYNLDIKIKEIKSEILQKYPFFKLYINQIYEDYLYYGEEKAIFKNAVITFMKNQDKNRDLLKYFKENIKYLSQTFDSKKYNEFEQKINQMSKANAEALGIFIYYRQFIIEIGKLFIDKPKLAEKYIHNLFIKQNTIHNNEDIIDINIFYSNLWILGDEFLTYTKAFSNKTIKDICLNSTNASQFDKDKPDIAIFYNQTFDEKSKGIGTKLVLIELKKLNVVGQQLAAAESQVIGYLAGIKEKYNNIKICYSFIIGNIDDKCQKILDEMTYIEVFPLKGKMLVKLQGNNIICFLNYESLILDSEMRNKVFIEILEKGFL